VVYSLRVCVAAGIGGPWCCIPLVWLLLLAFPAWLESQRAACWICLKQFFLLAGPALAVRWLSHSVFALIGCSEHALVFAVGGPRGWSLDIYSGNCDSVSVGWCLAGGVRPIV